MPAQQLTQHVCAALLMHVRNGRHTACWFLGIAEGGTRAPRSCGNVCGRLSGGDGAVGGSTG